MKWIEFKLRVSSQLTKKSHISTILHLMLWVTLSFCLLSCANSNGLINNAEMSSQEFYEVFGTFKDVDFGVRTSFRSRHTKVYRCVSSDSYGFTIYHDTLLEFDELFSESRWEDQAELKEYTQPAYGKSFTVRDIVSYLHHHDVFYLYGDSVQGTKFALIQVRKNDMEYFVTFHPKLLNPELLLEGEQTGVNLVGLEYRAINDSTTMFW